MAQNQVSIPIDGLALSGELNVPGGAGAVVLFAHGSGSSRLSPRNRAVAASLADAGLGTLLFDLLSPEEEAADAHGGHLRFDIDLLAARLVAATGWASGSRDLTAARIGYFGASTGAAAALVAAARLGDGVGAIVSRGGRPDLAGDALRRVTAPTLLIVGGNDPAVIEMNREAFVKISAEKALEIVPGAGHLFEEPGALDEVARLAGDWFRRYL